MLYFAVITICFALLGCFGMALRNKYYSIAFFTANVLLMLAELVLGSYWWYDNKAYMKFPRLQNLFVNEDINTGEAWAMLQIKVRNLQCI